MLTPLRSFWGAAGWLPLLGEPSECMFLPPLGSMPPPAHAHTLPPPPTTVRTQPHTLTQIFRYFHTQFKAQLSGPWAAQAAVSHDGGERAKKKAKTDATVQKRPIIEHVAAEELGAAKEAVR